MYDIVPQLSSSWSEALCVFMPCLVLFCDFLGVSLSPLCKSFLPCQLFDFINLINFYNLEQIFTITAESLAVSNPSIFMAMGENSSSLEVGDNNTSDVQRLRWFHSVFVSGDSPRYSCCDQGQLSSSKPDFPCQYSKQLRKCWQHFSLCR